MLASPLTPASAGVYIKVRLAPRASRDALTGVKDGSLMVRLTAPPVDGAANAGLVTLLSKIFGIRKGAVTITSGLRSKDKRVFIEGATVEELTVALRAKGVKGLLKNIIEMTDGRRGYPPRPFFFFAALFLRFTLWRLCRRALRRVRRILPDPH